MSIERHRRFQAQRFKLIKSNSIAPDQWDRVDGLGAVRGTPELALRDVDTSKVPPNDDGHYMDAVVIITYP
jgi:hypothetical protein